MPPRQAIRYACHAAFRAPECRCFAAMLLAPTMVVTFDISLPFAAFEAFAVTLSPLPMLHAYAALRAADGSMRAADAAAMPLALSCLLPDSAAKCAENEAACRRGSGARECASCAACKISLSAARVRA